MILFCKLNQQELIHSSLHSTKSDHDFILESQQLLDADVREKSFKSIKKRQFLTKGRMVKQVNSIEEIMKARFGTEALLHSGDIPACILCAFQQAGKKNTTINPHVCFVITTIHLERNMEAAMKLIQVPKQQSLVYWF